MKLSRFSVNRPVTITMIFLGVALLGFISWKRLPQELFPPITYPQLTVVTLYGNAAPEEMENLITKPLEEAIGTVKDLKKIKSISREGVSMVTAEFDWGTNMGFAHLELREKIDPVKELLPLESEDPTILPVNPFSRPIMILSVTGQETPRELLKIARRIKDKIEKVTGVASATISGGKEREILVEVDQGRLQASRISILSVVEALKNSNLNYPAGTTKGKLYEYLIRTMGEFKTVSEIKDTVVEVDTINSSKRPQKLSREEEESELYEEKRLILLSDLATVKDTLKEDKSYSRHNGRDNISLAIQKQAEANTIQTAKRIRASLENLMLSLPRGINLDVIYDESIFIKKSIMGVRNAAFIGGVLAFFVLYIFLKSLRVSAIICTSIPLSIMVVFSLMYFKGISINMMSLGGLALGVGMLVDNAIVVIENIFRHQQTGLPQKEAAVKGAEEVSEAITSSTLTTIAVFLPMLFVVGIAGQLFKDLLFAVTFSLVASLLVALTLVPRLAASRRKGDTKKGVNSLFHNSSFTPLKKTRIINIYSKLLSSCLAHKSLITIVVLALFAISFLFLSTTRKEFMPKIDQGEFIIKVNMPTGARLQVTDSVTKKIEELLRKIPEVKDVTATVGSSSENVLELLGSHQAQVVVKLYRGELPKTTKDSSKAKTRNVRSSTQVLQKLKFLKSKTRKARSSAEVIQDLKSMLRKEKMVATAEIEYILEESAFKSTLEAAAPVVIEIKGPRLNVLKKISEEVAEEIESIPGIYGVRSSLALPSPETKVHVDKDRASIYNLSVTDIARTALIAIRGYVATKFKQEGREIDITVRLRPEDRANVSRLRALTVHSNIDVEVPLAEVATLITGKGPSEIKRLDQQRTVLVTANIFKRSLNEVIRDIKEKLTNYQNISDYSVILSGETQKMRESFKSLRFALIFAIILVYMIMAAQFESLWQPFIIMFTLPLSLIGVGLALLVTHTSLNVIVLMGVIMLGGIVVNNGIVLIDYINRIKKEGIDTLEAVIRASKTRFRPILMTTLTTVLGLLPLALGFGEGAELRAPLAITVIGGLLTATFLTLLIIPNFYLIGEKLFEKRKTAP
ncbi:MAG: efflux RND transporter permease subunit [Elusimicrobia bacterium]|nr:MAG: efflux RND transporter permease subunit [Elusimicrobiota bacterium]